MSEKPKRDYRTGRITIEDAKKKFHEYYDKKATPRKGDFSCYVSTGAYPRTRR